MTHSVTPSSVAKPDRFPSMVCCVSRPQVMGTYTLTKISVRNLMSHDRYSHIFELMTSLMRINCQTTKRNVEQYVLMFMIYIRLKL
mmetsp:Transcript_34112/g.72661  ORF Transcript_34112/g.72661 Transcript_34112/m.72661 type:complete len:86 (-) Transcript_34112:36-293(-)